MVCFPITKENPAYVLTRIDQETLPVAFRGIEVGDYRLTASSQPSIRQIETIKANNLQNTQPNNQGQNGVIFDLREEPHFFYRGHAITYCNGPENDYNFGKTVWQIEKDLDDRFMSIYKDKAFVLLKRPQLTYSGWNFGVKKYRYLCSDFEHCLIEPQDQETLTREENVVTKLGMRYFFVPLTDQNLSVIVEKIDQLTSKILEALQTSRCIHFHCLGGVGRATIGILMTTFLLASEENSCEDLFNFFDFDSYPLEASMLKTISGFFQRFYEYCASSNVQEKTFHKYLKEKGIDPQYIL